MHSTTLQHIYNQLRSRYPLTLTSAFAVDDGFTEDMPIIVGRNAAGVFWLYEDGGDLVFSIGIPGREDHDHRHPQGVDEAVQAVISFMESR